MKNKKYIHYNREGDYLELNFGSSQKTYFKEIRKDILEKKDRKTSRAIGYKIFNFTKKSRDLECDIPIS